MSENATTTEATPAEAAPMTDKELRNDLVQALRKHMQANGKARRMRIELNEAELAAKDTQSAVEDAWAKACAGQAVDPSLETVSFWAPGVDYYASDEFTATFQDGTLYRVTEVVRL